MKKSVGCAAVDCGMLIVLMVMMRMCELVLHTAVETHPAGCEHFIF